MVEIHHVKTEEGRDVVSKREILPDEKKRTKDKRKEVAAMKEH